MKFKELEKLVSTSEIMYEKIDKSSFEDLSIFTKGFSKIYAIFHTREQYKIGNPDVPSDSKFFFDRYDSELVPVCRRVLAIANSLDYEFKKFCTAENPSLVGKFSSFFKAQTSSQNSNTPVTPDNIFKKYKTNDKNVALRRAAHEGSAPDVELLVNTFGADINSESGNGFTAMDWAFFKNHMEPHGVFNTLGRLSANKPALKTLLEKYVRDDETGLPAKDIALSRAISQENHTDIRILVDKYKADMDKAQEILDIEMAAVNRIF